MFNVVLNSLIHIIPIVIRPNRKAACSLGSTEFPKICKWMGGVLQPWIASKCTSRVLGLKFYCYGTVNHLRNYTIKWKTWNTFFRGKRKTPKAPCLHTCKKHVWEEKKSFLTLHPWGTLWTPWAFKNHSENEEIKIP